MPVVNLDDLPPTLPTRLPVLLAIASALALASLVAAATISTRSLSKYFVADTSVSWLTQGPKYFKADTSIMANPNTLRLTYVFYG